MSHLKDALDKAARTDGQTVRPNPFSNPPHIVPDVWQLDAPEPGVVSAVGPADVPVPEAPVQPRSAFDIVHRDADLTLNNIQADARRTDSEADFWATYTFGQRGLGKVVVGPHADSGLVEQYRRLGAALHHHQLQGAAHSLMVTSAVASEGKTLTATNLALTLSQSYQRRVLLIDADLRRPNVHEILRLDNARGLTDVLRRPDPQAAPIHTVSSRLSVLTAGRPDSDPMAGLVSETMHRLIADAMRQFDWVIVDTPPVALLPDANLLAAMIDTALLVVGANSTPFPLVRRAVEAIGQQRILGVVLNRMPKAEIVAAYNYYGYGKYAYGSPNKASRGLFFWKRPKAAAALQSGAPTG